MGPTTLGGLVFYVSPFVPFSWGNQPWSHRSIEYVASQASSSPDMKLYNKVYSQKSSTSSEKIVSGTCKKKTYTNRTSAPSTCPEIVPRFSNKYSSQEARIQQLSLVKTKLPGRQLFAHDLHDSHRRPSSLEGACSSLRDTTVLNLRFIGYGLAAVTEGQFCNIVTAFLLSQRFPIKAHINDFAHQLRAHRSPPRHSTPQVLQMGGLGSYAEMAGYFTKSPPHMGAILIMGKYTTSWNSS
ncbi:hypothetical protein CEXT_576181 [Caerostris extrusa]|uniref:Uncharacterized protein n=1 Tax=Caerostris extrusa TaxID=172846 RepID=A0AAV4QK69_CAEEX|nr:hypothetical protein CEXT_576181 [Caerostris extrusa]